MRCFLWIILLACATLTACRKHRLIVKPPAAPAASTNTLVEGTVIRSGGNWHFSEHGASHSLSITVSGKQVGWRHESIGGRSRGGSISSAISLSSPTAPWFIYVEAPDILWFFDGEDLSYRRFNPDGLGDGISMGELKVNAADVPPGLVPQLPAELQKLFPPVEKKPRPSI